MPTRRYLCSDLVRMRISGEEKVLLLEEIWQTGAVIESEDGLGIGARVEIPVQKGLLAGRVTEEEAYAFGFRATVEFSPLTPWSEQLYRPEHLFDPGSMRP